MRLRHLVATADGFASLFGCKWPNAKRQSAASLLRPPKVLVPNLERDGGGGNFCARSEPVFGFQPKAHMSAPIPTGYGMSGHFPHPEAPGNAASVSGFPRPKNPLSSPALRGWFLYLQSIGRSAEDPLCTAGRRNLTNGEVSDCVWPHIRQHMRNLRRSNQIGSGQSRSDRYPASARPNFAQSA